MAQVVAILEARLATRRNEIQVLETTNPHHPQIQVHRGVIEHVEKFVDEVSKLGNPYLPPTLTPEDAVNDVLNLLYFGFLFSVENSYTATDEELEKYVSFKVGDLSGNPSLRKKEKYEIDKAKADCRSISKTTSLLISRSSSSSDISHQVALRKCLKRVKSWFESSNDNIEGGHVSYVELRGKVENIIISNYFTTAEGPHMPAPLLSQEFKKLIGTMLKNKVRNLEKRKEKTKESTDLKLALLDEFKTLVNSIRPVLIQEVNVFPQPLPEPNLIHLIQLVYLGVLFDHKSESEFTKLMLSRIRERGHFLGHQDDTDHYCELLKEEDLDLISKMAHLIVSRPVQSNISHKDALESCMRHAKLWLLNSDQPIEGEGDVTYAAIKRKLDKILKSSYFTQMKAKTKAPAKTAATNIPLSLSCATNRMNFGGGCEMEVHVESVPIIRERTSYLNNLIKVLGKSRYIIVGLGLNDDSIITQGYSYTMREIINKTDKLRWWKKGPCEEKGMIMTDELKKIVRCILKGVSCLYENKVSTNKISLDTIVFKHEINWDGEDPELKNLSDPKLTQIWKPEGGFNPNGLWSQCAELLNTIIMTAGIVPYPEVTSLLVAVSYLQGAWNSRSLDVAAGARESAV